MRLIERVCEENLLNPQVLASANEHSQVQVRHGTGSAAIQNESFG